MSISKLPFHLTMVIASGDFIRVITGFSQGGQDPCSTNPAGVGGCPANGGNGGTVPEPAPLSLLFAGMIGIGVARRFKTKKNT